MQENTSSVDDDFVEAGSKLDTGKRPISGIGTSGGPGQISPSSKAEMVVAAPLNVFTKKPTRIIGSSNTAQQYYYRKQLRLCYPIVCPGVDGATTTKIIEGQSERQDVEVINWRTGCSKNSKSMRVVVDARKASDLTLSR
jgi:hypothetical protein